MGHWQSMVVRDRASDIPSRVQVRFVVAFPMEVAYCIDHSRASINRLDVYS